MWPSLLVGTFVIGATVLIHVLGLLALTWVTAWFDVKHASQVHRVLLLTAMIFGLFVVCGTEIWLWAGVYWLLGVTEDFASALYLSTATFSTVGYGDVVPEQDWRLLAALEGVTGFLIIGWSTAYLVSAGTRLGPFRSGHHF